MSPSRQRVWIDTDPAFGLPGAEVDDGLALLQAFASPELEVAGVSVVFGNTSLDRALPVAERLVADHGPAEVPVLAGAAGAETLGQSTAAVTGMAAALEAGPLSLLALGPLTNVGSLLRLRPDLAARVDRIVAVAGRRVGQSFLPAGGAGTPHRDLNFELDPAAMAVVLGSDVELVLAPWEVSSQVWLRAADLDWLAAQSARGAFVAAQVRSWLEAWQERFGVDGFNPFDTLAVGCLTHPQLIETLAVAVSLEEAPDDIRRGETKPHLHVRPVEEAPQPVRPALYATTPDRRFKGVLLERLAHAPPRA